MADLKQILIAIGQLINAMLGGWADETLSSRAHRQHPRLEKAIDTLFGAGHCAASYRSERERLQFPPELRT